MDCYLAWFVVISLIYSAQGLSTLSTNGLSTASQFVQPNSTLSRHKSVHAGTTSITQRIDPSTTLNTNSTASLSAKPTPSSSGHKQVSPNATITNSVNTSSSSITRVMNSSTITPSNTHSINPNMTSPVKSNSTHVNPNMTSTHHSGTHVSPTGAIVSPSHSMGPTHKSAGKDDDDYDDMKKRMWVAASFAIIFALTTVILACLVYRQRKINRELEGDPASSRLL